MSVGALAGTAALEGARATAETTARTPARVRGSLLARAVSDPAEFLSKFAIASLFLALSTRILSSFLESGRPTGVLLLASEALVVVCTILRRPPASLDRSVKARLLAGVSILGPFLLDPTSAASLLPELLTVALAMTGLVIEIVGKLALGRSFGLMPANRGIVCRGPYRLVRHPIYAGYLLMHAAFLAANPTGWNLVLLLTADTALLVRAAVEERTLALDARYAAYRRQVPYRILPLVY